MVNVSAIPDYSSLAAAELKLEAKQWSANAQRVIDDLNDRAKVETLLAHTHQLKNAADLLGYSSMRFGLTEIAELLDYQLNNFSKEQDLENYALVLVQVSEELSALSSLPATQARSVSALTWLAVIDNCRACRQVAALSKDVVAAAGIALPSTTKLAIPAKQDCEDFLLAIQAVHNVFAKQFMASLRNKQSLGVLEGSSRTFIRLAEACQSENRLSALEPLFRAAGVVLACVVEEPERYSTAVQRMYARLERYLAELSRMEVDLVARTGSLVPDDLLRQLLFYVARFSHSSADAKKLKSEFGLHVLNTDITGGNQAKDATYKKLREQVLQQIDVELNELQSWMNQAAADPKHKTAKRLFKRLGEQHLAAGILGLADLEAALANLRIRVRELKQAGNSAYAKLRMAEQILRIRDLLLSAKTASNDLIPKEVRKHSVDDVAAKLKQLSRHKPNSQFHTESVEACIQALQTELRQAEPELTALFEGRPMVDASAEDIAKRFEHSGKALALLPLPEVVPLIDGLATAIRNIDKHDSGDSYQANIAELLVALDLYLDSLCMESKSLTPLLQYAVEAMRSLLKADASADTATNSLTLSIANDSQAIVSDSSESLLDTYLMANQRINPWVSNQTSDFKPVAPALAQLGEAAKKANLSELHELAHGCLVYMQQDPLPDDAKDLVGETLLVVPQMLHAEPGVSESVRGLEALKARLAIRSTPRPPSVDGTGAVAHGATNRSPNADRNDTLTKREDPLDNTLHNVFSRECTTHIETLRQAIRVARADLPLSKLPSDGMLRALHTLSGCTQTVDATDIFAIVQPLQKASLSLQRSGLEFSDSDTDYIEKLADVLEARLQHFQYQGLVDPVVLEIEEQLPEFVATVLARTQHESDASSSNPIQKTAPYVADALLSKANAVETNEAGLSTIFRAEADDLMLRLRAHTAELINTGDKSAKQGALRVLHTIKGSARMSGSHAMADAAHELESEVSGVADTKAFGEILRQRLPELQACLASLHSESGAQANEYGKAEYASVVGVDAVDADTAEEASEHSAHLDNTLAVTHSAALPIQESEKLQVSDVALSALPVREASLEELLNAGTTLVSRQAEVDGRIAFLSDHIRDIQASALRLQRLATDNPAFDSVASKELVADIQVAQRQLDQSLQALQHVHGLASHSGTTLHRALMQARLKTVDSLQPRLEAVLSDAAIVCHREASLLLTGGELPVSATLLNAVAPLLEQLIRNAVAHGFDSVAVREAEQKPADGEIAITVRVDGTDLLIDVSDDGEGIDEDALNQQRADEGLPPIRSAKHLREILCSPGYSTLDDVTPVAGRGQGLSMVLDGVEALSGELAFINDPGEGLTVRLRIPQPMVVAKSLVFGDGALLHAIPVGYIACVVPFDEAVKVVQHAEQSWPVCTVEQLIGVSSAESNAATRCVLVKIGGENLAIPVPSLEGYKELIVQPLSAQLQSLERYVGGAVLSDGRNALILNLHRLCQLRVANEQSSDATSPNHKPAKRPIALIADDSVTMRVAGERLLQRLGFQVHTARDGLEALDFLKRGLPSVLLLDIEMPGADGFDVVRRTHAKLVAAEVPVIMISTRRGPEERERARSLGIQHLIHKPYTETRLREALEEVGVLESYDGVN